MEQVVDNPDISQAFTDGKDGASLSQMELPEIGFFGQNISKVSVWCDSDKLLVPILWFLTNGTLEITNELLFFLFRVIIIIVVFKSAKMALTIR